MEYLLVTTICSAKINPLLELSKIVAKHECHILLSRMDTVDKDCAVMLYVKGNWSTIAKIETAIATFARSLNIEILLKRTEKEKDSNSYLPYTVQIISVHQPELVYEISEFFAAQEAYISNCKTFSYSKHHTQLFELEMSVYIPSEVNLADMREQFLLFCEELNVDGVIEPERK